MRRVYLLKCWPVYGRHAIQFTTEAERDAAANDLIHQGFAVAIASTVI